MKQAKSLSFLKRLFSGLIILAVLSFTTYMGALACARASKDIGDLTYVSGQVTETKMVKHTQRHKFRTTVQHLLVLKISGSDENFGFLQSSDAFKALLGFNKVAKTLKLFYDPEGERIQDGITLHTLDLSINQAKIIDFEQAIKEDRNLSIFFFV